MGTRQIATLCLHTWECSDIPGIFTCLDCDAEAIYNRDTQVYWIED